MLEYIEDLDIGLITSSMILTEALKKEIISIDTANSLYVGMIRNGMDLPCNSFLSIMMNFMMGTVKNS